MRPLLKLVGRGEIHAADSLTEVTLTRKIWYVLALLVTAPDTEILRSDLTRIAWPLSDDRSRDVLMHKWRKSVVEAFAELGAQPVVVISERIVKLDTTLIQVDYLECLRIGQTILVSTSAAATITAALEFDSFATDQVLLAGHPDAFEPQRTSFDALRIQCLERGWKAAMTLGNVDAAEKFDARLKTLGYTGTLVMDPAEEGITPGPVPKPRSYAQGVATILLIALVALPIFLGKLSQPMIQGKTTGNLIPDQPPTYIGRYIQYQYTPNPDDKVTRSEAIATVQLSGRIAVTTGVVRHANLDQQVLTVCTSKDRKLLWSTLTP